jgi:hypothetical protein
MDIEKNTSGGNEEDGEAFLPQPEKKEGRDFVPAFSCSEQKITAEQ